MNENVVVHKINMAFINADYPIEMYDISDVESFLGDESNAKLEIYEVIEQLYSQLMEDTDI